MNNKVIFHIDMDAFFASVEIAKNPQLKNKPVIVGGKPDHRGVVSTCSYEARKFGIHSAMSLFEAYKRCPHAIFLEGNFTLYRQISHRIMQVLQKVSPLVEIVSIDEAYLDVTHKINADISPLKLGHLLREYIYSKFYLTCSIGIASNKLVAKIASSFAKPNKVFIVENNEEKKFLAPLKIEALPGIGPKSKKFFNDQNITTIGELQQFPLEFLVHKYGNRGYDLYFSVRGVHHGEVNPEDWSPKSIGAERTFDKDCSDLPMLESELIELMEKAYQRLLKRSMRTKSISLKIRFSDFKTINRSRLLFTHTNHKQTLKTEILQLFKDSYDGFSALRLIGISLEKLTNEYWQPTLWEWEAKTETPPLPPGGFGF